MKTEREGEFGRISEVHLPNPNWDWKDASIPIRVAASATEPLKVVPTGTVMRDDSVILAPGEEACFRIEYEYEPDEDYQPKNYGNRFRVWRRVA